MPNKEAIQRWKAALVIEQNSKQLLMFMCLIVYVCVCVWMNECGYVLLWLKSICLLAQTECEKLRVKKQHNFVSVWMKSSCVSDDVWYWVFDDLSSRIQTPIAHSLYLNYNGIKIVVDASGLFSPFIQWKLLQTLAQLSSTSASIRFR